jgi:hypothetical protein
MSDLDSEVRAGGDIIFRVDDRAAILQYNRPAKRNALACDIRLASPHASFAIPAVRHGIVYERPTVTPPPAT